MPTVVPMSREREREREREGRKCAKRENNRHACGVVV